ncbi:MAG: carbohydrate ABC transporter permease [Lachnospiraceae bacterium]|nr:carbohydrate ABC transporter permease [Lachnospiraceae bacterium]
MNSVLSKQSRTKRGIWIAVFIVIAFVQLFPLIWLIDFSLCKSNDLFTSGILVWPEEIQWVNYFLAFRDGHFLHYLGNSLLINTLAVALVILISVMASFACTRMHWKLKNVVAVIMVMGMMIPIHATLLPNYVIYDRLKLTDTIWALLIPYVAFSLPQGYFLTSGFMASIPRELEEAALIDGCGVYRVVFIIIMPLMKASIATVDLNNWNEFMMATTYLSSDKWKTLPFCILEFTGQYSSNYAVQFAVMALSAAPALIVYIFLNKYITKGVALGAVKG